MEVMDNTTFLFSSLGRKKGGLGKSERAKLVRLCVCVCRGEE